MVEASIIAQGLSLSISRKISGNHVFSLAYLAARLAGLEGGNFLSAVVCFLVFIVF